MVSANHERKITILKIRQTILWLNIFDFLKLIRFEFSNPGFEIREKYIILLFSV